MIPTSYNFDTALKEILSTAQQQGKEYVDVVSGDLHRRVGGYPGRNHRMPMCCSAMKQAMKGRDQILDQPFSGQGASLKIRYYLPR